MQDSKRDTDVMKVFYLKFLYEKNHQSGFDAGYRMLGAGSLG